MKTESIFRIVLIILSAVLLPGKAYAAVPFGQEAGMSWKNSTGERIKEQFMFIDGERYYFDSDGFLVTERLCCINEELYYFDENGRCARNLWKYLRNTGSDTDAWYFFTSSGKAFRDGWIMVDGKKYHFSEWKMDHGWYLEEDENGLESVYYLGTEHEGAAVSGWFAWKGGDLPGAENRGVGWYYFQPGTYRMVNNREETIDGFRYAFREDGRMAAGFVTVNGVEKYYDPVNGRLADGWYYVEECENSAAYLEGWYYFNAGQALRAEKGTAKLADSAGTAKINGQFYGFDESGRMLTGVVLADNGKYYCFGTDGILLTGLVDVSEFETTGCTAGSLPAEKLYFSSKGSSPPVLGASYSGEEGSHVYRNGVLLCARNDTYEVVETETELGTRSFVVDSEGTLRKNGTVILKNGEKKQVLRRNGSYYIE